MKTRYQIAVVFIGLLGIIGFLIPEPRALAAGLIACYQNSSCSLASLTIISGGLTAKVSTQTTEALNLFVDPGGNDSNTCTTAEAPCLTIEAACAKIPDGVCHPVTVTVDAGTYASGGCHLIGKRQCAGSAWAPDGGSGVGPGSITIQGVLGIYAPADAGTGSGTLTSVSNGTNCTKSVYTDSNAAWNTDELKGKLLDITSGTGSGTGSTWPIVSNTATAITIAGIPGTNPTAGSGYAIKERSTSITAAMPDTHLSAGPIIPAKTARKAAFVIAANNQSLSDETTDRAFIRVQRFKFNYATDVAIWTAGPVAVRENEFLSSVIGVRTLPGDSRLAIERNTVNGTGAFLVGGNSAYGNVPSMVQMYNNMAINSGTWARMDAVPLFWSKFNTCVQTGSATDAIITNSMSSGKSSCDSFTGYSSCYRGWGSYAATGGVSSMVFNGLTCDDNSRATYNFSLSGPTYLTIDDGTEVAVTSTITASTNIAALGQGGRLRLQSTSTTYAGAGQNFVFTDTAGSLTLAALRAMVPKAAVDPYGSSVSEGGGTAPLWFPALVHGATPKAYEAGSSTFSTGTRAITFGSAFIAAPDCTCTTISATVPCSISVAANTTSVTFAGTGSDAFSWFCTGSR